MLSLASFTVFTSIGSSQSIAGTISLLGRGLQADLALSMAQLLQGCQARHVDGWLADDCGVELVLWPWRTCSQVSPVTSVKSSSMFTKGTAPAMSESGVFEGWVDSPSMQTLRRS